MEGDSESLVGGLPSRTCHVLDISFGRAEAAPTGHRHKRANCEKEREKLCSCFLRVLIFGLSLNMAVNWPRVVEGFIYASDSHCVISPTARIELCGGLLTLRLSLALDAEGMALSRGHRLAIIISMMVASMAMRHV